MKRYLSGFLCTHAAACLLTFGMLMLLLKGLGGTWLLLPELLALLGIFAAGGALAGRWAGRAAEYGARGLTAVCSAFAALFCAAMFAKGAFAGALSILFLPGIWVSGILFGWIDVLMENNHAEWVLLVGNVVTAGVYHLGWLCALLRARRRGGKGGNTFEA